MKTFESKKKNASSITTEVAPALLHPEFKGDRNAKSMKQSCQGSVESKSQLSKKRPAYIREVPYQAKKSPAPSTKHKHNQTATSVLQNALALAPSENAPAMAPASVKAKRP